MTTKKFPTLYGECQTGKTKVYEVSVVTNDDGSCSILREHGQLNGAMQIDEKRITSGKNIGKANETSVFEQAVAEATSMWQKKKDANYVETLDNVGSAPNLLPMLAQSYKDVPHRMKFPCYGQPKLNGVRCLAKREGDKITFSSRKGKSYDDTLQHLVPELLEFMYDGDVFDGEIYIHGKSLQQIVSYVKRLRPESSSLQYWVYDMINDLPFSERYHHYDIRIDDGQLVKKVGCVIIETPEHVKPNHDNCVQEGYEGMMLRNMDGKYVTDHRSADLLKVKEFVDSEFEITGYATPATGRYSGCCVFECKAANGKGFDVCPRGSVEIRQQYLKDAPKLLGRKLTVRYQNLSDDGIPIFPVGIAVRDYE
jgi:DNA ligase-1